MLKTIEEKDEEAESVIYQTAVGLAIAGALNPIPMVGDVTAIIAGWLSMLYRLARIYEAKYDKNAIEKSLLGVLKSAGWYGAGTLAFMSAVTFLKWTGFGALAAAIVNALLNAAFTIAVGNMYKDAWRRGEEPSETEMVNAIKNSVAYASSNVARQRAREIYDQARREGLSREAALERVVKALQSDLK